MTAPLFNEFEAKVRLLSLQESKGDVLEILRKLAPDSFEYPLYKLTLKWVNEEIAEVAKTIH